MVDELLRALNKLFWKLILPHSMGTNDFARYIASELQDTDVTVLWDETEQKFTREDEGS